MLFGAGVSCRTCIVYSIVNYLCVSCNGSITSFGESKKELICFKQNTEIMYTPVNPSLAI